MNAVAHSRGVEARPFFLPGGAGPLFGHYFAPRTGEVEQGLLIVPPFAEELNRSRRMMSLLGHELAARGCGVLLLDLYGTGDSSGEFTDARWSVWLDDLGRGREYLQQQGLTAVSLLGIRTGALLALEALQQWPPGSVQRLLFWQPVLRGDQALVQFLRLRVAASMMNTSGEKETTQGLKALLEAGESVEVAGYELAPELALALDGKCLADGDGSALPPLHWFELIAEAGRPLTVAAKRQVEAWQGQGAEVNAVAVVGEPFWTLQETTVAPALLEATVKALVE